MVSHTPIRESDLIREHRKFIKTYMKEQTEWKLKTRNRILKVYDSKINKENIRYYINQKARVFVLCLAADKVKKAAKYFPLGYLDNATV